MRIGHASRPEYCADSRRPNREHCANAESFAGEGVRLVRVKSLQVKATKAPCPKALHCDKFVAAICRIFTLLPKRLASFAEWRRGWCHRFFGCGRRRDGREEFASTGCWRMPAHIMSAVPWGRARESEARLWVAGHRVNLLLPSSGCAPN